MLCSKQQTNIIFGNMFLSGLHITPFIILHVSLSFHNSICPGFVVSQWLLLNWVWGSGKGLPWYGVRSHGRRGKHESLTMNSLSSVLLSVRWMFSPLSLFPFSTSLKKPEFLRTTSSLTLTDQPAYYIEEHHVRVHVQPAAPCWSSSLHPTND